MITVVLALAVVFQIHVILGSPSLTVMPPINEFCEYDAFIASTPYNDKVFLHPWKRAERNADWFEARGYCAQHCAELVTIESEAENLHFLTFMRSINLNDAVWLGAESDNTVDFTNWSNGRNKTYSAKAAGEYNEGGHTCINAAYGNTNFWYNYLCTYPYYLVACQRPASWTICGGVPKDISPR